MAVPQAGHFLGIENSAPRRFRGETISFRYLNAYNTRHHEAKMVATVLDQQAKCRRGAIAIGELMRAVLARLGITTTESKEDRDRSRTRVRIDTAFTR
jgi:hypothetical protein